MRFFVLLTVLTALPAAAQTPPPASGGGPADAWVTNVVIMRVEDEFAAQPESARMAGHRSAPWAVWRTVRTMPAGLGGRPLRNDSFILLDIGPAGEATGCRPLRASAEPRLDTFACELLREPGYFRATLLPPSAPVPAQRWVIGVSFQTSNGSAEAAREARHPALLIAPAPPGAAPPPRPTPPASTGPRRALGRVITASDYAGIDDLALADGNFLAELEVDAAGNVTDCRVVRSTGNAVVDSRSCDVLRTVRYSLRVDASGNPIADRVSQPINLGWVLHGSTP